MTWVSQFSSVAQSWPGSAAHQASLSITNSWSLLKIMSMKSVMPSNHIILCHPLQSFPASGSFPMSQFFASELEFELQHQSFWWIFRTDFLQDGTGWIFLQSKGLSRVFSSTTVQSIDSSALSILHSPTFTSIHNYLENHSLTRQTLSIKSCLCFLICCPGQCMEGRLG